MSKWLTAVLSLVSIAILVYFNFVYQSQQNATSIPLPAVQSCKVNQQVCQLDINNQHTIAFSITPFNAKPMTTLSLNLSGVDVQEATVTIDGVNMTMPGFPIQLLLSDNDAYTGETALALCALGDMQWQASLTVKIADQSYLIPFLFTTTH
ncbi:MAG: hypothetical protein ACI86X_000164 [Moritella sp.]|jgi:hypothetical protein